MKLLFIINSLGYGGAETQLLGIIPEFINLQCEVSLITMNSNLALLPKLDKRVTHYDIGVGNILQMFKAMPKVVSIIKKEKPDLIHSHLFQSNILSRLIKLRFPGIKIINTTHCNYNLDTRSYNPYFAYKLTRRLVDFHTAVSEPALQALREKGSISVNKSRIVFNAINTSHLAIKDYTVVPESHPFRWIAVGRLCKDKDYYTLLDAAKILIKHNFELHIAGAGDLLNELEQYRAQFDTDNKIKFLGVVKNINEMLSTYDAYIISSQNEALPMALLEAMAAGLPVVGTDVGQIRTIVDSATGGIIVKSKAPQLLADAMQEVMNYPNQKLSQMGTQNREYIISNFTSSRIADTWLKLYSEVG